MTVILKISQITRVRKENIGKKKKAREEDLAAAFAAVPALAGSLARPALAMDGGSSAALCSCAFWR